MYSDDPFYVKFIEWVDENTTIGDGPFVFSALQILLYIVAIFLCIVFLPFAGLGWLIRRFFK